MNPTFPLNYRQVLFNAIASCGILYPNQETLTGKIFWDGYFTTTFFKSVFCETSTLAVR